MDDDNELPQSTSNLSPGVPTVWRLPGGTWIIGFLPDGFPPCYFVGGPFSPSINGAFTSFWAASAAIAKALKKTWAQKFSFPMVPDAELVPADGGKQAPERWVGAIYCGGIRQGFIATIKTGPVNKIFDAYQEARDAVVEAVIPIGGPIKP